MISPNLLEIFSSFVPIFWASIKFPVKFSDSIISAIKTELADGFISTILSKSLIELKIKPEDSFVTGIIAIVSLPEASGVLILLQIAQKEVIPGIVSISISLFQIFKHIRISAIDCRVPQRYKCKNFSFIVQIQLYLHFFPN